MTALSEQAGALLALLSARSNPDAGADEDPLRRAIAQERGFARLCSDSPQVTREVHQLLQAVWNMADHDVSMFRPRQEFAHAIGQVGAQDVAAVVAEGNIREQMTLLMNFTECNCGFLWRLVFEPAFADKVPPHARDAWRTETARRRARISKLTGVPCDFVAQNLAMLTTSRQPWPSLCDTFTKPDKEGPVSYWRYVRPEFRTKTDAETRRKRRPRPGELYPALSRRESALLRDDTWTTGHMVWDVADEDANLFTKYCRARGITVIAGPSANTDMALDIAQLFGADLRLMLLACIAWLGDPPHHSAFEVISAGAAEAFGLPALVMEQPGGEACSYKEAVEAYIREIAPPQLLDEAYGSPLSGLAESTRRAREGEAPLLLERLFCVVDARDGEPRCYLPQRRAAGDPAFSHARPATLRWYDTDRAQSTRPRG